MICETKWQDLKESSQSVGTSSDTMLKLDLLLRTGKLLVESSADTSRIMRNMRRTAAFLGLPEENLHIFINYNMLMVNLSGERQSLTKFQRCEHHCINMDVLSEVSHLSWRALRENYSLEQYGQELERIGHKKRHFSTWTVAVGAGLACGGFCIQFGCDWIAFFYASIAAILGFLLKAWLTRKGSNKYVNIAIAAFVSTLIAWAFAWSSIHLAGHTFLHSSTPWHPLMACALFIVPGVPLINFVSDMLDGYVQIGLTRATNTLLIILAMSFGIAFAIQVCGIDNFVRDLSMTPHHQYNEYMLAAAISAIGFSMIFNTPRQLHLIVALGGMVAICTRNFVSLGASSGNLGLDMGAVVGSFCGSALVSILCTRLIHVVHVPHHCIAIPSVIPMIPGVLMYRALFAFIDMHGIVGEVTVAMNNAIHASLIILFIAVGVAIPNIFFRRMVEPKRRLKLLKLLIERRKEQGRFVDMK